MIQLGPWNRLPLKIRWLEQSFYTAFPANALPSHMMIYHGPIKAKNKRVGQTQNNVEVMNALQSRRECHLCMEEIENLESDRVFCVNGRCRLVSHIKCLAKTCLEPGHYVPIQGVCPLCDLKFLWGDVIRKKKGCLDVQQLEDNDDVYDI